jgi:hypothetical protein
MNPKPASVSVDAHEPDKSPEPSCALTSVRWCGSRSGGSRGVPDRRSAPRPSRVGKDWVVDDCVVAALAASSAGCAARGLGVARHVCDRADGFLSSKRGRLPELRQRSVPGDGLLFRADRDGDATV